MTTDFLNYLGFIGTFMVVAAYIPQIDHLIKENCSYGISNWAWGMWLVATFLMLPNAFSSGSAVFAVLLSIQVFFSAIILFLSNSRKGMVCFTHSSNQKSN